MDSEPFNPNMFPLTSKANKSPKGMRMAVDIATIERDENEMITEREAVPP